MNTWNETFERSTLAPNSFALENLSPLRLILTLNDGFQMQRPDLAIPILSLEPGALLA